MAPAGGDRLAEGWAALRVGDAATARRVFEAALADEETAATTEGLARAAYLEFDYAGAIDGWERSYAAYREAGDDVGAVRAARKLGYMYGTVGDWAVGSGWIARAQTLAAADETSSEAGWVALNVGMFEGDRPRKEAQFRTALAEARRHSDTDLELSTLAYLGASLVHGDRTEEGMMLLDEALAGVAGGDVDDFLVVEEVFCQLFSACEHAHDVTRADQWIRVGEAIAQRRNLPVVTAFCRTHYGGVLTAAGRWPEADATLTEAVRLWSLGRRSGLREGALIRLADLRVRQGRLEEAEQLLDGTDVNTNTDAARPQAAIYLARGETALARDLIERALTQTDSTSSAGGTAAHPARRRPSGIGSDRGSATRSGPAQRVRKRTPERLPRRGVCTRAGSRLPRDGLRRSLRLPARSGHRLRPGPDTDGARPMPVGARERARGRSSRGGAEPRPAPHSMRSSGCRRRGMRTRPQPSCALSVRSRPACGRRGAC